MQTFIVWALPRGSHDRLDERPLTSKPVNRLQAGKVVNAARRDGWHGFRVVPETNGAVRLLQNCHNFPLASAVPVPDITSTHHNATPTPTQVPNTMAKNSTTPVSGVVTPETPEPTQTKAEALAAERKAKREAKAAEKEARKAANLAKREDGVIGTIKAALARPDGVTKSEMLAQLQSKFPDRDPMGMACTVGIQFSRLSKTRKVVNRKLDRGRVYGFQDTVQFPEVTIEAVNAKPAPDSQPLSAAAPLSGSEAVAALKTGGKGKGKKVSK